MHFVVEFDTRTFDKLMRERPRAVTFAWQRARNYAADSYKKRLHVQWHQDMYISKKKTFPRSVLRIQKFPSKATKSHIDLGPARVYNITAADLALRAMLEPTRRGPPTKKAKAFYIPFKRRAKKPRKRTFKSGAPNIYASRGVLWRRYGRKGRKREAFAAAPKRFQTRKRIWHVDKPLRYAAFLMPRLVEDNLRREYAELERRTAFLAARTASSVPWAPGGPARIPTRQFNWR